MSACTTGVSPVTRPGRPWYVLGFSFSLSVTFSLWLAWVVGRNLGLFFGGLILGSLLAPLLVVAEDNLLRRASLLVGLVAAITIVWLGCVFNNTITLWELASGNERFSFPITEGNTVLACTPDGRTLLVAGEASPIIQGYSVRSGKKVVQFKGSCDRAFVGS